MFIFMVKESTTFYKRTGQELPCKVTTAKTRLKTDGDRNTDRNGNAADGDETLCKHRKLIRLI